MTIKKILSARMFMLGALALCLSVMPLFAAISVTYNVDVNQNRTAISPYIYGSNFDHVTAGNMTVRRMGGNRLTGYNWENNFSNAGSDWVHSSDEYMSSYIPAAERQTPGKVVTDFIDTNLASGKASLITLQMAGYVAADKNGTVTEAEVAPSTRWKEVVYKKGTAFCNPAGSPDKNDGAVYMDELVNYLVSRYGNASTANGVKFYAMDNEPALWSGTHARIHPVKAACQEMITRTTALAGAVKDVDPYAQICGPVLYGFGAFNDFQGATDWSAVKTGHSYSWFIDYYLDEMNQKSQLQGRRLLDVLDVHWYPEAQDADNVRITEFRSTNTNYEARMQAPRTLWDQGYYEKSWIGDWFKWALPLLPKLNNSISTWYAGTKLAFTEYDYGGQNHISGGVAQADVLGLFGKYGVHLATYWGSNGSYTNAAFNLFRNYDGGNSAFGDTSVYALMSDKVNSSIYASAFSADQNKLTLIVMNKHLTETIQGTFELASPLPFASGRVWGFDSAGSTITERTPITGITGNTFAYTIPPLTVYHIVLQAQGSVPPTAPVNLTSQVQSGQVVLNWDSNPEPDIAGYKVYRSTTSGQNYTEIASVIATNTYTDTTISEGVIYYYVVSAVNNFAQEGPKSGEVSALWGNPPAIYEAEDALLSGASVSSNNSGYSGTGYVDYQNLSGDYIEWTVVLGAAGNYTLEFQYANGSTGSRPLEIRVNGQVAAASLGFGPTGGWATWAITSPLTVSMNSGTNLIRATAIGSSGGNVDYLLVNSLFTNTAPAWNINPVTETNAAQDIAYNSTLADDATDTDSDPLTFAKVSGPAWLTVASNGILGGMPGAADVGLHTWTVQVSDNIAAPVETILAITVVAAGDLDQSGCINQGDLILFVSQWMQTVRCSGPSCPDFDQNTKVELSDFAVIALRWLTGNCP